MLCFGVHQDVAVDCGKMEAYVTYNITDPGYALINDHYSVTHEHPVRVPLNSTEPGDLVKFRLVARRVEDEEAELLNCNGFNYTVSVRTKLGGISVLHEVDGTGEFNLVVIIFKSESINFMNSFCFIFKWWK